MSVKRISDKTRLRATNTNALISSTTTVATNAHGGAFNTPWGGSIIIRRAIPHELEMSLAFAAGGSAIDCVYHFLINSVCLCEAVLKGAHAVAGMDKFRKTLEDLTPGTYTWAIQGSVATAGTAYLASSSVNRSFVSVKEAVD